MNVTVLYILLSNMMKFFEKKDQISKKKKNDRTIYVFFYIKQVFGVFF